MRADCAYFSNETHRLFDRFQSGQKPLTSKAYAAELSFFCAFIEKDFLLATADECRAYYEYLNGKVISGELKTSTVTKKMHQLTSFSRFVKRACLDYANPFRGMYFEEAAEVIPAKSFVSLSDLDRIIGYLLKKEDYATYFAVLFSVKLMLRLNELRTLTIRSFSYDEKSENYVVRVVSSSGDVRYVKVSEDLFSEVMERGCTHTGYIISKDGTKPVLPRWLQRHLMDACLAVSLPDSVCFQDLRNTGILVAGRNGVDKEELSKLLGHRSMRHIERLNNIEAIPLTATDYVNIYVADRIGKDRVPRRA